MKHLSAVSLMLICISFVACTGKISKVDENGSDTSTISIDKDEVITSDILTAEQQAKLTPEDVLLRLKNDNKDFCEDNLTIRNNTERIRKASLGQYPKAVILSCLDSRVPVEDVFHSGLGNLFVLRVAGNVVNDDILGSLEYACKKSGSKLILVLGHEYCGAITSAIDEVKLGNITKLLAKIEPSVAAAKAAYKGDQTTKNPDFVEEVCKENVEQSVKEIRSGSPILSDMENKKQIMIVGGIYNMNTGKVDFFDVK